MKLSFFSTLSTYLPNSDILKAICFNKGSRLGFKVSVLGLGLSSSIGALGFDAGAMGFVIEALMALPDVCV